MFGGPWDSTLIMMGVPSLKMGSHLFIRFEFWKVVLVHPSVKGFEQALAVKQVSQNISHFCISTICIDRNFRFFYGAGFLDDSDFSESKQPLEDGSWSVSAFVLQKKFLRSLCSNILAAVYF